MVCRLFVGAALAVLVAAQASNVAAQSAADTSQQAAVDSSASNPRPASGAKAPAGSTVDEVIVTAQRRAQSAQNVGISLTVLSSQDLEKRGVFTINQLQNAAPSLEVEPAFGSGEPQFRIRGVGFSDYASNNSPTVGIYVNEVAYPVPAMTQGAFFDVARIEVLRGPQGTLYGRNTTGGAVNIVTNQPTKTFSAGAEVEYGSFGWLHAEGYVSGPLAEGVTSRLAVFTEQGGGFQHNRETGQSFGDADRYGLRDLIDWTPTGRLSVKVDIHGFREYSEGNGLYLFAPFSTENGAGPTIPADTDHTATGYGLNPTFAKAIGASVNSAPFRHNVQDGVSINARYDVGFADLVNIASYDYLNRREYEDFDASQYQEGDTFFHDRDTVVSDELRLISNGQGPFRWIGGIYLAYQNANNDYLSDFTDIYGVAGSVHYSQRVHSEAIFGQAEYHITPKLNVTLGLRYEDEIRKLRDFYSDFLFGTIPVAGLQSPSNASIGMSPVTGKAAVEYTPVHDLLLYTSASRGVKSGGFTAYNTATTQGISAFKPESLWAYEGGFKSTLPYTLRFNGSIFYYDYTNEQVLSALYTPPTGTSPAVIIGHFVNAPRSHIYGGEFELLGEPLPHLTLSQQVGYKIGRYDNFPNYFNLTTDVPESLTGHRIPFPKLSYDGEASYWFPAGAGYKLEIETDYSYHDYAPFPLNDPTYDVRAYWLANANLTLTPPRDHWTAAIWCRNLFDKDYDLTRNFFVPASSVAAPGRPRSVGGRVTYAF